MLVLSRKRSELIRIGPDVVVEVLQIKGNRVSLGIVAPKQVSVVREKKQRMEIANLRISKGILAVAAESQQPVDSRTKPVPK